MAGNDDAAHPQQHPERRTDGGRDDGADRLQQEISTDVTNAALSELDRQLGDGKQAGVDLVELGSSTENPQGAIVEQAEREKEQLASTALSYLQSKGFEKKTIRDLEQSPDQQARMALFAVYWSCAVDLIGGACSSQFPADRKTSGFTAEHIAAVKTFFAAHKQDILTPTGVRKYIRTPSPLQEQLLKFLEGGSVLAQDIVAHEWGRMVDKIEQHGPTLMEQYTRDLALVGQHGTGSEGVSEGNASTNSNGNKTGGFWGNMSDKLAKLGTPKNLAIVGAVAVGGYMGWRLLKDSWVGKKVSGFWSWLTGKKDDAEKKDDKEGEGWFDGALNKLLQAGLVAGGLYGVYRLIQHYYPDLDLKGWFGIGGKNGEGAGAGAGGGGGVGSPEEQVATAHEQLAASPVYAQQADKVAGAVNAYFVAVGGDADILGDGEAEQGAGGLSVALLASQGNVGELLDVASYQRLLEQATQGPIEKIREEMKGWGTQRLQAFHKGLQAYAESQTNIVSSALMSGVASLVGGVIPTGPDALTAAQQMKVLLRKQLNVLTWLHEARARLYESESCAPEEILTGFMQQPLIGTNGQDAVTFLEQKGCLHVVPSAEVHQATQAHTQENEHIQKELQELRQDPEKNKQELKEMCDAYVEEVDEYGARSWASKWFSGLHEVFSMEVKDTKALLEATGYTPLAEELTRGAKEISSKIARGEQVTQQDYDHLASAHDRYTRFLNEFTAQRLVVTEEMDAQGRKKISLVDRGRYAALVYGKDVARAAGDVGHGAVSLVMSDNKREGAMELAGGYIALERYTYPWRKMLGGIGMRSAGVLRPVGRVMNRLSPTEYVIKKTFIELSKVTASSGNETLKGIGAKGIAVFRYRGPDAAQHLIRDFLLGRIDEATASAVARTRELGNASDIVELLIKNGALPDYDTARVFVRYAGNPLLRNRIVTTKRVWFAKRAKISLGAQSEAMKLLNEMKKLDDMIEKVPNKAEQEALRAMMTTVADLEKAKAIIQQRNKLRSVFQAFVSANSGLSATQRGRALGTWLATVDDVKNSKALLVALGEFNKLMFRSAQLLRSIQAANTQLLRGAIELSEQMVVSMRGGVQKLVVYLKTTQLAKSPYAAKTQLMIRELEEAMRLQGSAFGERLRLIAQRFPSIGPYLGNIARGAGVGLGGVTVLFGSVVAYQALQEAKYLDVVNPEMGNRTREYAGDQLLFTGIGGALIFVPGPGWLLLPCEAILSGLKRGSDALYETERAYRQTVLQLMQEGKSVILQQLVHNAFGQHGVDRGIKEKFARFWGGGVDFDFLSHNSTQNAIEAYLRLTYAAQDPSGIGWITTLTPKEQQKNMGANNIDAALLADVAQRIDKQVQASVVYLKQLLGTKTVIEDYVVWEERTVEANKGMRFGPGTRKEKVPVHKTGAPREVVDLMPVLLGQSIDGDAYAYLQGLFAESVYATTNASGVALSPQRVGEDIVRWQREVDTDIAYKKSLDSLYLHNKTVLAHMSMQADRFVQENMAYDTEQHLLQAHVRQLRAYVNVKAMTEGRDPTQELAKTYITNEQEMRGLLLTGKLQPVLTEKPLEDAGYTDDQIKEMLCISGYPVQDSLYRIATETLGTPTKNTRQDLQNVFAEVHQKQHGLYVTGDGKSVAVYNEWDPKDMKVPLDVKGYAAHTALVELQGRVGMSVKEGDLVETGGTAEKELSRLQGKRYSTILYDMITLTAVRDYPLKLIAIYGKEQKNKRFRLPISEVGRCIELGYRDMGQYQFMCQSTGEILLKGPGKQPEDMKAVIAREPSLQHLQDDYERIVSKMAA